MVALLDRLRHDWIGFCERLAPTPRPQPGLFTYRLTPPGGQVRIHLRVAEDGSGVLFIDVTDVLHLNPTATELAKWALEGVPRGVAAARLRGRYGPTAQIPIERDLEAVYGMVERFADPQRGCPTCSLAGLQRRELFSVPVTAPFKADLALTYDCNNDCPHCYNEADRLALGLMSAADWQRIVDTLTRVGVPHLIFTGGEATLHPDLLTIIRYADQCGHVCGLNTNGRRLAHKTYAQQLAEAGLNHVQVTLGSHRADVHNRMMHAPAFEQTLRGIENALAAGLHTITNTTLMKMNSDEIETTIEFIYSLGIRTFAVNGMIYSGGGFDTGQAIAEQQLPPILIRIRDKAQELGMRFLWYTPTQYCRLSPVELEIGAKRCNAGEYSLCVEPNGDVLPCQSFYVTAGNLLRDPWEHVWQSGLMRSFRDRTADPRGSGLPEMCWECPDLALCGGGCRIEREAASGVRSASSSGCSGGCCGGQSCGTAAAPAGFVALDTLQPIQPVGKRRGTGQFAESAGGPRNG